MKATSAVVALLVVLAPLLGGASAVAGLPGGEVAGQIATASAPAIGGIMQSENASNASLGSSISSFMQASEADAQTGVDNGMFDAAFDRANESEQARLVTDRTGTLEQRLDALRQERQEVLDGTAGGNLSEAERAAKIAQLTARIQGLERAINQTEVAAERTGVDTSKLQLLRSEARNMTGPEVAQIATGLTDIDRRNHSVAGRGNGTKGPSANPPTNRSNAGNASDAGSDNPPGEGEGSGDGGS